MDTTAQPSGTVATTAIVPSPNGAKPLEQHLVAESGQIMPLTMAGHLLPNPHDMLKMAQVGVRYNVTQWEQKWTMERATQGWDHCRPKSVYIAAIGSHWRERCWARVSDMLHYSNQNGLYAQLVEIQDRCDVPYDAMGVMRNEAILKAMNGWEFLCMIDTDVLPLPETLIRLLNRMESDGRSIIVPYVDEPGTQKVLHGPEQKKFSGVHPIRWAVLSFMLFRTSIFNAWPGGMFWDNPRGADEGYHFQKLYSLGHIPVVDTDIVVPTQSAPTYPLTVKYLSEADQKKFWDMKEAWRRAPPDRRPLSPGDPRQRDGMYLPFLKPPCPQCKKEMREIPLPDGVTFKCDACAQAAAQPSITVAGEVTASVPAIR